jgi:hypothetical protein
MIEDNDDEQQPLLYNAVTNSPVFGLVERQLPAESGSEPIVYRWRWVMLSIVSLLNLSNGMVWFLLMH